MPWVGRLLSSLSSSLSCLVCPSEVGKTSLKTLAGPGVWVKASAARAVCRLGRRVPENLWVPDPNTGGRGPENLTEWVPDPKTGGTETLGLPTAQGRNPL